MQKFLNTMKKIILGFCLTLSSVFSLKAQDLSELVNDSETFLVDVRTPEEFAEGNVEGSVNIPIQILHEHLAEFMGKDKIVVFCRRGVRSAKAVKILEENGIKVVNGGTWQDVKKLKEGNE